MTSIRKRICATSLRTSPNIRSTVSASYCPRTAMHTRLARQPDDLSGEFGLGRVDPRIRSAADIPPILRSIATDPGAPSTTEGAWFELWSALCQQGDVYPASFAAVPHVIDILSANLAVACFD